MSVVPYYPLNDEMIGNIIRLQLRRVEQRVTERYSVRSPTPLRCGADHESMHRVESGGRMIEAVLNNTCSRSQRELLLRAFDSKPVAHISVDAANAEFTYSFE